jgi:hypothetical protein
MALVDVVLRYFTFVDLLLFGKEIHGEFLLPPYPPQNTITR